MSGSQYNSITGYVTYASQEKPLEPEPQKPLGHWAPIMEEWIVLIERYCRVTKGKDAPYWYTERANIGILAGAVWRCGKVALEEFQHEKLDAAAENGEQKKRRGRCDLWIADEVHKHYIEAKQAELCLHPDLSAISNLAVNTLNLAVADAKRTKGNNENINVVGIAFLPVYLKKEADNIPSETLINQLVKEIKEADLKADLVAWCFPSTVRELYNHLNNYLPGVILLAKQVS